MARALRLQIPGVPLHIIQRGNNKMQCFFGDEDRVLYLGMLEELARENGCSIHAYVLMTNHVHLLATPHENQSASLVMKNLGQRYAAHVNRRFKRSGPFWDGRFRSNLVDSEEYLFTCYRYIELNPVRAGMVKHPVSYEWSSFPTNALGFPSTIIVPHERYLALDQVAERRQQRYRDLVDVGVTEAELIAIRSAVQNGFALGRDEFIDEVERRLGKRARPLQRGAKKTQEFHGAEKGSDPGVGGSPG